MRWLGHDDHLGAPGALRSRALRRTWLLGPCSRPCVGESLIGAGTELKSATTAPDLSCRYPRLRSRAWDRAERCGWNPVRHADEVAVLGEDRQGPGERDCWLWVGAIAEDGYGRTVAYSSPAAPRPPAYASEAPPRRSDASFRRGPSPACRERRQAGRAEAFVPRDFPSELQTAALTIRF